MRRKDSNKNCSGLLAVGLLFWCLFSFSQVVVSGELGPEERCLDCHDDTWAEGLSQRFIHEPFQEQQCQICHVSAPLKRGKKQDDPERAQVKWIARNFTPAATNWFVFSLAEDHATLFVEVSGNRGKMLQQKLPLPDLADLPQYDNDHAAPKIYNVKVLEVKKGLFLSATIGWETNEVANSAVNYGIKKINTSSPRESIFSKRHQVTLTGIKSSKTYQFEVVSEDLFGNKATSEVYSLVTDKTFSVVEEQLPTTGADFMKIGITAEFFQSDGRYVARIDANQPVKMAIGSMPNNFRTTIYVKKDDNATQEIKHVLTNSEFHLNISICYGCHRKYQASLSHPVNVYPKRGMVIPSEYPTLKDGRMTCMSCHDRHASNRENRLIKSSSKALCSGCHKEMG